MELKRNINNEIKKMMKIILPDILSSLCLQHRYLNVYRDYLISYKSLKRIKASDARDRIRVVFIVEYPEVWNSMRSVYRASNLQNVDSIVVCVPKKHPQTNSYSINEKGTNEAYDYLTNLGIEATNAFDGSEWFDLEAYQPDYVFYTRPYNTEYPTLYKTSAVSKYARVCYIPYAFSQTMGRLFDITFNYDFMLNTYLTFVPNRIRLHECRKKFAWQVFRKTNFYEYLGFPRFDLLRDLKAKDHKTFTVLWIPRWFVGAQKGNKGTHFLDYWPKILNFAQMHPEINIIVRPHPLMFKTMIDTGEKTKDEVEMIKRKAENMKNLNFDDNKDYLCAFQLSDVMVSDYSSLMIEYFATGKPIIYCDDATDFNTDAKLMYSTIYHADKWEIIDEQVLQLYEGKDSMKQQRASAIKELMPENAGSIGEEIIKYIINDYKSARG